MNKRCKNYSTSRDTDCKLPEGHAGPHEYEAVLPDHPERLTVAEAVRDILIRADSPTQDHDGSIRWFCGFCGWLDSVNEHEVECPIAILRAASLARVEAAPPASAHVWGPDGRGSASGTNDIRVPGAGEREALLVGLLVRAERLLDSPGVRGVPAADRLCQHIRVALARPVPPETET